MTKKGALITQISKAPITKFKKLVVRELLEDRFLGDVSMAHLRLPSRTALPNVVHLKTSEVIVCLDGRMTATIAGKSRLVKTGALIYIPPGVWHRFETKTASCAALALFSPGLTIGPGADIHGERGVTLWD